MQTSPPPEKAPGSVTPRSSRDEWVERLLRFEPHSDRAGVGAAFAAMSGFVAAVWFNFAP